MIAKRNAVVATHQSRAAAEVSVKEMQQSGVHMKMLSIVGRDYHSNEHVVG